MENLGFYTCCNDTMLPFLKSWVGAARRFNAALPLGVIPFNDDVAQVRAFCEANDIRIVTERLDDWRRIGETVYGQQEYRPGVSAANYFSKLCAFSGPFLTFAFADVNALVMFELRKKLTRDHFRGCGFMSRAMLNRNYRDETVAELYRSMNPDFVRGYNAGFFVSRRNFLTVEEVEAAVASSDFSRDYVGPAPEQSLMSWLEAKNRKLCFAIARSAGIVGARMVDDLTIDRAGLVWNVEGRKVDYIKWTGQKAPDRRRNRHILQHFSDLGQRLGSPV